MRTIAPSLRSAAVASGPKSACWAWPVRCTPSGTTATLSPLAATLSSQTLPTMAAPTSATISQTMGCRQGDDLGSIAVLLGAFHGPPRRRRDWRLHGAEEGAFHARPGAAVVGLDHEHQRVEIGRAHV